MNLKSLVKRIVDTRQKRGFVNDPLKLQILLTEEVGEISSELRGLWSKNANGFCAQRLGEEISDVMVLLLALADEFDIDVETAIENKFFSKDETRRWKSAEEA